MWERTLGPTPSLSVFLCPSLGCKKDVLTLLRVPVNLSSREINHVLICRKEIAISVNGLNPFVKGTVSNIVLASAENLGSFPLSMLWRKHGSRVTLSPGLLCF